MRRQTGNFEFGDLVGDPPVPDRSAGIRSGIDRNPGLVSGTDRPMSTSVQIPHVRRVDRIPRGRVRDLGKVAMLISVGTKAVPCATINSMVASVNPVPCSMQSMPALIRPGRASSAKT